MLPLQISWYFLRNIIITGNQENIFVNEDGDILEYMYSVYKSTNNKLERRYHIVISAVIPVLWGIQKDTPKKWVEILFLISLIHTPHFRSSFGGKMSIIHVIHL